MADYDAEDLGLLAREVVLPHRDAEYVSRLLEKLLSQEVFGALDLVKVSIHKAPGSGGGGEINRLFLKGQYHPCSKTWL